MYVYKIIFLSKTTMMKKINIFQEFFGKVNFFEKFD